MCAPSSPIAISPRFNAQGDVVTPMTPSPFINPMVIHRTAALAAAEEGRVFNPFRYREGVALPGGAATMPLRYLAAAALGGTQAAVRGLHRARPAVRRRRGLAAAQGPTLRRLRPDRRADGGLVLADGGQRKDRRRPPRAHRPRGRGAAGLPGDGEDAGRGGHAALRGGGDAAAQRLPDPGRGAGHVAARPLPPRGRQIQVSS